MRRNPVRTVTIDFTGLRLAPITLPDNAVEMETMVENLLPVMVQQLVQSGQIPRQVHYPLAVTANCSTQSLRNMNNSSYFNVEVFSRETTTAEASTLSVSSIVDPSSGEFTVQGVDGLADAVEQAVYYHESDMEERFQVNSGFQYVRGRVLDYRSETTNFQLHALRFHLFLTPSLEDVVDGDVLNMVEDLAGMEQRQRRRARAQPSVAGQNFEDTNDPFRRQVMRGAGSGSGGPGGRFHYQSYSIQSDYIRSFVYSDFRHLPYGTLSMEAGLCVVEALEYIKQSKDVERCSSRQVNHIERLHIDRELFVAEFYRNDFTVEEIDSMLEGDLMNGMMCYKSRFPDMDFGLFTCYDESFYDLQPDEEQPGKYCVTKILYDCIGDSEFNDVVSLHKWWIVNEKMHVVPLDRVQFKMFYIEERFKYSTQFKKTISEMVLRCNMLKREDVDDEDIDMIQQLAGPEIKDLASVKPKPTFTLECDTREEDIVRIWNKKRTQIDMSKEEFIRQKGFGLNNDAEKIAELAQVNVNRVEQVGIIGFDIETVIRPDSKVDGMIFGNSIPIACCAYGYAYIDYLQGMVIDEYDLITNKDLREKKELWGETRVQRVEIQQTWHGEDCLEQFVKWIMTSGIFCNTIPDKKWKNPMFESHRNPIQYVRDYKNIIVAHNGARFDFRLIIELFAKYGHLNMTGDLTHLKSIKIKNISLVDSFLIAPMSLKNLCKSLGVPAQKFPFDIEDVTYENWYSQKDELLRYCMQDCVCVFQCYEAIMKARASAYYNNRGFVKALFPVSASSGAVQLFQQLYLEQPLNGYEQIYRELSPFYIGGITSVFSATCDYGISFDINGSYNAAMHNLIPTEPIWHTAKKSFILSYEQPLLICNCIDDLTEKMMDNKYWRENRGRVEENSFKFKNTNSYRVVYFRFEENELFPAITQKMNGRVFNVLESSEPQWVWGVKLNFVLKEQNVLVVVDQEIQFERSHVFRKFVQDKLRMRKEAKAAGNKTMDLLHKLDSNSVYGKMGQERTDRVIYGTIQQLGEFIYEKKIKEPAEFKVKKIKPLMSLKADLYEMKYVEKDMSSKQIGLLKHIASYITTLGHIYLFQMILLLNRLFPRGSEHHARICYTDTDSTFVDLSLGFTQEQKLSLTNIQELSLAQSLILEQGSKIKSSIENLKVKIQNQLGPIEFLQAELAVKEQEFSAGRWEQIMVESQRSIKFYYDQVKELYRENEVMKVLAECKIPNPLHMEQYEQLEIPQEQLVPIIDDSIPGAYKIEKFIMSGYFLGAKMYAVRCFDVDQMGKMVEKCKMKGISEQNRQFRHYKQLYESVFGHFFNFEDVATDTSYIQRALDSIESDSIIRLEQKQFRALHTGIRIYDVVKVLIPTLYKRYFYDRNGFFSRPFESLSHLQLFEQSYKTLYDRVKRTVKQQYFQDKDVEYARGSDNIAKLKDKIWEQYRNKVFVNDCLTMIDNTVARPWMCNKMKLAATVRDKFQAMHPGPAALQCEQMVNETLDEYFDNYSQWTTTQYCDDSKQCRKSIFKYLILRNFVKLVLGNDLVFENIGAHIEQQIEKVRRGEQKMFRFGVDMNTIIEKDYESIFAQTLQWGERHMEAFNQCDQLIRTTFRRFDSPHHAIDNPEPLIKILVDGEMAEEIEKIKKARERGDKFNETRKNEIHSAAVLINLLTQRRKEEVTASLRRFVQLQAEIRSNSSKIECVIKFLRAFMDDDRLFYGVKWDQGRQWTKMRKEVLDVVDNFWETFADEKMKERCRIAVEIQRDGEREVEEMRAARMNRRRYKINRREEEEAAAADQQADDQQGE